MLCLGAEFFLCRRQTLLFAFLLTKDEICVLYYKFFCDSKLGKEEVDEIKVAFLTGSFCSSFNFSRFFFVLRLKKYSSRGSRKLASTCAAST